MTLTPERAPINLAEHKNVEDPFKEMYGFELGEQVTVRRSSGNIESDWNVRGYKIYENGEIAVEVTKPSVDENGERNGSLVKTYSPEQLKSLQNPAEVDEAIDNREVSPTGSSIIRVAERINTILERRAIDKAHGEALKEYRDRDHSDYIDHLASLKDSEEATPMARATAEMALEHEHPKDEREEMLEKAKAKIRGFGRSALARLKNASLITVELGVAAGEAVAKGAKRANETMGDAVMIGLEKTEASMDAVGKKIVETKSNIKTNRQTRQFNRETKADQKQFQKEYAREMKNFDKEAAHERKLQTKVDKRESKLAAKEDRRFERSMRKKAAEERRTERHARWAKRYNFIKEAAVSAPEMAADAMMTGFSKVELGMDKVGKVMVNGKEAASAKIERSKASVHTTRAAGKAALEAFKNTRQIHNEQNQL